MPAFSRFLRYFMAVGRSGSIRKAADILNVSASAIDRQILNVEADLGMPLFERLSTGLRLTAAGEILMASGERWQKSLADVRAQIEGLRGLKRGHVDIAIIDALTKGYLPATLQSIRERYPGITISVRVLTNDAVRTAMTSGEVDFGIFFEPQSFRNITVRAFVDVVLGLVTPAGHPMGSRNEVRFSTCVDEPLVVPAEPLAVSQQVAVLEGITGAVLDKRVASDNIEMIKSLVLQGMGIGILTSLDVIAEVRAGSLSFTKISDTVLRPMTLALCTTASRTPSYAAGLVIAELEHGFAQLGYPASIRREASVEAA